MEEMEVLAQPIQLQAQAFIMLAAVVELRTKAHQVLIT
jgi:hypothetical protein